MCASSCSNASRVTCTGHLAPDVNASPGVAVEIRSHGQFRTGSYKRCLWYAANGVEVALLVDDRDESVMVFRPGTTPQATESDHQIDLSDVVRGLAFTPAELLPALKIA